jgi:hypothetical protein
MSDDPNDLAASPAVAPLGDDGSDAVAETRDQDAGHGGEPEAPPRRPSRHERYKRAIERLRQENTQLRGGGGANDAAAPEAPEAAPVQQHGEASADRERRIRHEAAFELRAKDYFRENPTAQQEIGAALSLYKPADHVADVILRSEIGTGARA